MNDEKEWSGVKKEKKKIIIAPADTDSGESEKEVRSCLSHSGLDTKLLLTNYPSNNNLAETVSDGMEKKGEDGEKCLSIMLIPNRGIGGQDPNSCIKQRNATRAWRRIAIFEPAPPATRKEDHGSNY
jgi:hypothetical protein